MPQTLPNHPVPHSIVPPVAPDLTGRVASCAYCGKEEPSSEELAFFIYRGPGSSYATDLCVKCRYRRMAHTKQFAPGATVPSPNLTVIERGYCDGFVARAEGLATDEYFCGCRGWD